MPSRAKRYQMAKKQRDSRVSRRKAAADYNLEPVNHVHSVKSVSQYVYGPEPQAPKTGEKLDG